MPFRTVFRPAQAGDHPAIASLWHIAWHEAHDLLMAPEIVAMRNLSTFVTRLDGLIDNALVAVTNDRITGFSAILANEIDQFYVDADSRGTGLAQELMAATETALAEKGVTDAVLQCAKGNIRAHRFYEKCGWFDSGVEDHEIWMPDNSSVRYPTHIFTKQLNAAGNTP